MRGWVDFDCAQAHRKSTTAVESTASLTFDSDYLLLWFDAVQETSRENSADSGLRETNSFNVSFVSFAVGSTVRLPPAFMEMVQAMRMHEFFWG